MHGMLFLAKQIQLLAGVSVAILSIWWKNSFAAVGYLERVPNGRLLPLGKKSELPTPENVLVLDVL
jgi:hypothetical protein